MKRRIISLALCLSALGTTAFAADNAYVDGSTIVVPGAGGEASAGSTVDVTITNGKGDSNIVEGTVNDNGDVVISDVNTSTIDKVNGNDLGSKPATPVNPTPPSNGGGNKSHNTIVPATAGGEVSIKTGSHGAVSISPKKPSKGDKVTITVKPDDGYELDSIKVTSDGSAVKLTDEGDNVFSFTMPGDDVTITTSFKLSESVDFAPAQSFRDVAATDWYASAVAFVAERGMMAGNNGLFSPNDNLTRSMMAQILYNVEGASGSGTRTFPDVKSSDWFAGAVSWAASQGLMDGYGAGNFGPNDSITREQLASILYRYASVKGYGTSANAELGSFVDGASTSSWAAESVRWAVGSGLLTGKSGGRLDPTGTATRAEVAQILMNFYTQVAD